jgi:ribose 5-phosphate isomerase A
MSPQDLEKKAAAEASLRFVRDGMVVGLGSGSTSAYMIRALGAHLKNMGWRIRGVPTSEAHAMLARECGIALADLNDVERIDLTIDGADEIGPRLALVKGGGGAHLREKCVAAASRKFVVIADSSKVVAHLGAFPLPVEVLPFAWRHVFHSMRELGLDPVLRRRAGSVVLTDQGNYLADCRCGQILDPETLDRNLKRIPGVFEHGLFLGMASCALVARGGTVEELTP